MRGATNEQTRVGERERQLSDGRKVKDAKVEYSLELMVFLEGGGMRRFLIALCTCCLASDSWLSRDMALDGKGR